MLGGGYFGSINVLWCQIYLYRFRFVFYIVNVSGGGEFCIYLLYLFR